MITEGEAAILLEMTQRAFRNKSQSKQRSTLIAKKIIFYQDGFSNKFQCNINHFVLALCVYALGILLAMQVRLMH